MLDGLVTFLKDSVLKVFDKMPAYIVAEGDEHFHEWLSSELTGDYKIKVTGEKEKQKVTD